MYVHIRAERQRAPLSQILYIYKYFSLSHIRKTSLAIAPEGIYSYLFIYIYINVFLFISVVSSITEKFSATQAARLGQALDILVYWCI